MTPSPRQTQPAAPPVARGRPWSATWARARRCRHASTSGPPTTSRSACAAEVGEHDELPAEDRRWLERARAALPDSVRPAVDSELAIFGSGLIVDRPEITDASAFVDLLRATTGREFVSAVLADQLRDAAHEAEIAAALDGDRTAIDAVLASWPEHKHGWLSRILSDSDELVGEVADLMSAWLPLYQEIEPRVRTIIERDIALRAGDRKRLSPADLVERTTNGIRWLSEPGVRRVVLAPVLPGPAVQLHVRRWRLADLRLPGRGRGPRAGRSARAAGRRAAPASRPGRRDPPPHPAPAARPRLVPHRDRRAPRAQQADHQAPPRTAPGRGPRDAAPRRAGCPTSASGATASTTRRPSSSSTCPRFPCLFMPSFDLTAS